MNLEEGTTIESSCPAEQGATLWQILRTRVVIAFGKALRRLGVPGAIRNEEIFDELTGQRINIRVGVLFTVINVNGRDYYFGRFSGYFDGTGMSVCEREIQAGEQ